MSEAEGLALPDPLLAAVKTHFDLDYLYPYQRLVIANTMEAGPERSAQIVVLPTGSGKSLCFTLPIHFLTGLTVVVYPLIALMEDQLRRMKHAGIRVHLLRGGQSPAERTRIFADIRGGRTQCVLANPEVLAVERVRVELARRAVDHLVIDEAHCVSEWGTTFRPAYLTLSQSVPALAPRMVTAFTATASPTVLESVRSILFGESASSVHLVQGDPDRPNIRYHVIHTATKDATLRRLVSTLELPAIVFCRSRKRVEGVARELCDVVGPTRCGAYHAGLLHGEREEIERWFFHSCDGVLAATCAYGMGVDKSNVRTVIHYEAPSSVEAFLQESGRAGRDGSDATSLVLWNERDRPHETDAARRQREQIMLDYLTTTSCRRAYLMAALGAESNSCFGCDSCAPEPAIGTVSALERVRGVARRDRERASEWLSRNRRRYTPLGAARRVPIDLPERDRAEMIATILATGRARVLRSGPWRGRITVRRAVRQSI